jgi:hypothetical protein
MAEVVKETVITRVGNTNQVPMTPKKEVSNSQTVQYVIYFLFGILEILLAFRLIFKLTGANSVSAFVSMIYSITGIFIVPFEGIFRRGYTQGIETTSVLEPSTLVAIVVYAILAWGIVKLVKILSGESQAS